MKGADQPLGFLFIWSLQTHFRLSRLNFSREINTAKYPNRFCRGTTVDIDAKPRAQIAASSTKSVFPELHVFVSLSNPIWRPHHTAADLHSELGRQERSIYVVLSYEISCAHVSTFRGHPEALAKIEARVVAGEVIQNRILPFFKSSPKELT